MQMAQTISLACNLVFQNLYELSDIGLSCTAPLLNVILDTLNCST